MFEVAQGHVRFVRGFSLRTGQLRYQFDLAEARGLAPPDAAPVKVPVPAEVRYTLTVSQGHVFACLGDLYARPAAADAKRAECWLVCLRLPETGPAPAVNAAQLKRWGVPATHKSADRVGFEGAPVVIGDSVFVVRQHQVGTQTTATLCCFAADTGEPRWEQVLCETVDLARVEQQRRRPALLTQAGPLLIYCSHAGAVVAVEADSGKRAWAVRYASRAVRDREPCPPLAVDRSVIVAPVDLGRLLCLDAATGQTLWERSPVDVSHLLGVCQGRLVFTTPTGLRAVLADSGADAGGWSQPALGSLPGCGRGLIAGGWVFWPTVDPLSPYRALHALDGGLIRGTQSYEPGQLQALPPGNLAYGQGCLVIATGEELWGYTVPAPPAGKPDT